MDVTGWIILEWKFILLERQFYQIISISFFIILVSFRDMTNKMFKIVILIRFVFLLFLIYSKWFCRNLKNRFEPNTANPSFFLVIASCLFLMVIKIAQLETGYVNYGHKNQYCLIFIAIWISMIDLNTQDIKWALVRQGTLTEGEHSAQLTSLLR